MASRSKAAAPSLPVSRDHLPISSRSDAGRRRWPAGSMLVAERTRPATVARTVAPAVGPAERVTRAHNARTSGRSLKPGASAPAPPVASATATACSMLHHASPSSAGKDSRRRARPRVARPSPRLAPRTPARAGRARGPSRSRRGEPGRPVQSEPDLFDAGAVARREQHGSQLCELAAAECAAPALQDRGARADAGAGGSRTCGSARCSVRAVEEAGPRCARPWHSPTRRSPTSRGLLQRRLPDDPTRAALRPPPRRRRSRQSS